MRASCWEKSLNNNARCHHPLGVRGPHSWLIMLITRKYPFQPGVPHPLRGLGRGVNVTADPAGFRGYGFSPVLYATSRFLRDFRRAKPVELSSREILPGACTAVLQAVPG